MRLVLLRAALLLAALGLDPNEPGAAWPQSRVAPPERFSRFLLYLARP